MKYRHDDIKCETCGIRYRYSDCLHEYTNFKDDLIEYICLCYNKNNQETLEENLKERFFNTCKFSNHDDNKFILLFWKYVYPYKYIDDWEKVKETSLPEKNRFLCSHLNMEDITDSDDMHIKIVRKDT